MGQDPSVDEVKRFAELAEDALSRGHLHLASSYFDEVIKFYSHPALHYDRGLTAKYLRDWEAALHHSLKSQSLRDEFDEGSAWNAAIAATALHDWTEARKQWALCEIPLPGTKGPIEANFGGIALRPNPWSDGETVFAGRTDPARAVIDNVPMPQSGFCFGDIVLHDGAPVGQRYWDSEIVAVFNALERWQPSEYETYAAVVTCPDPAALAQLLHNRPHGVGQIEDWTASVNYICIQCSYGLPHYHADPDERDGWQKKRQIGIAALDQRFASKLLSKWQRGGAGRIVDAIEHRTFPPSAPPDGHVWWGMPEMDDEPSHA